MVNFQRRWISGFVVALMFFVLRGAQAQTARPFQELQGILKPEHIVIVVDRTGQDIRGKVAEISTSSLVLLVAEKTSGGLAYIGAKRTFAEGTVAEIFDSDLSGRKGRRIYLALARSFQDLQQTLKVGQMVEVTDDTGQKTKGKVAAITGSSLVVLASEKQGTGTRTFTEPITEVRVADRLSNGAGIGVGVGLGLGLFPATFISNASVGAAWLTLLAAGAGGAAIGAAIDASMVRGPIIYVSPRRTQGVKLSPILGKDRQGVLVSVRF